MLWILFALFIGILGLLISFEAENLPRVFAILISSGLFGIVLSAYFNDKDPKAIDVYRGKTELQITYKGNVPVDTVVVFKNK